MSHKTLLKRFRGETSSSTAEDLAEREDAPMEIGEPDEPDEPDPEPRRPRERFSHDELERLKKKYSMLRASIDRKQRKYNLQQECLSCVKRFDDIVRKVHDDLLAGRITMVGVTLTRKLPIKTRNRRVQTSPVRVEQHQERMQPTLQPTYSIPLEMQSVGERMDAFTEQMHVMPQQPQPVPERQHAIPEQLELFLQRMKTMPEYVLREQLNMYNASERMHRSSERMHRSSERMRRSSERMNYSPDRMHHTPDRAESSPERDDSRENSLTRDFCGGTDPSPQEGECQCNKCLVHHNDVANVRATRTKSRNHLSRIHRNRAHSTCKDDALTDLHQHVLAGDEKTPGCMYVDILSSLHEQGPCEVPCKLRADVVWMNDHIPKQAETQTDLTADPGVRDMGTQTNIALSIGIQNQTLSHVMTAGSSRSISAFTQLNLSDMPVIHRPVGRVLPTVVRNRF